MKPVDAAKAALGTLWTHKYLWFFGLFLAAGGGPNFSYRTGAKGLPTWFWPAAAGFGVVAIGWIVLHVLSEGALIEAVRAIAEGGRTTVHDGLRRGRRHFWRLAGVKAATVAAVLVSVALIAIPAMLGALGHLSTVLAILATIPLALVGAPWLLTVDLLYQIAMRTVVLEGCAVLESITEARRWLRGRLLPSLQVLLLAFAGQMGAGAVGALLLLPALGIALAVYFSAGLVPAIVSVAVLAAPVAVVIAGMAGTYQSALWTFAYMSEA